MCSGWCSPQELDISCNRIKVIPQEIQRLTKYGSNSTYHTISNCCLLFSETMLFHPPLPAPSQSDDSLAPLQPPDVSPSRPGGPPQTHHPRTCLQQVHRVAATTERGSLSLHAHHVRQQHLVRHSLTNTTKHVTINKTQHFPDFQLILGLNPIIYPLSHSFCLSIIYSLLSSCPHRSIPEDISLIENLRHLDYRLNQLKSRLPSSTQELPALSRLNLRGTDIRELDMKLLPFVEDLNCSDNKLKSLTLYESPLHTLTASNNSEFAS